MPELPEVETTRRGLEPSLVGRTIQRVVIRQAKLRHPIPSVLTAILPGHAIRGITRRAKYLLIQCGAGWLILHLGMSGSLRLAPADSPAGRHDHFDLVLDNGRTMRLRDPRRFGAVLWTEDDPAAHPLLRPLGVEPLSGAFTGDCLHAIVQQRTAAIKSLLMNSHLIAGIGNIYANEALFRAGVHPETPGRRLSRQRCGKIATAAKETLRLAIAAGGSSLRDFVGAAGQPGYFQQQYSVYGRGQEPCRVCATPVRHIRQGQRSTFYCPHCQQ